jgi:hypothetical protein
MPRSGRLARASPLAKNIEFVPCRIGLGSIRPKVNTTRHTMALCNHQERSNDPHHRAAGLQAGL